MTLALIYLLLTGCATPRYLTEAEDAEYRAACEQTGCIVVPVPAFRRMLEAIKGRVI